MPKAKILVIDDEPGMLRAVERILSPDYHVATTSSAGEALASEESFRPDLVICDISMPRADGFEVMSRLKSQRPDVDVILMTGLPEADAHLVRAIREKAFYFIQKPFNRDVMRTLVDRCLELRRLREAEQRHVNRVNRELSEARALQQMMLPPLRAVVNGVAIDARCIACSELGGDVYDYAPAGRDAAAMLVADVSGHGVSAALLTTIVKAAFWSSLGKAFEPLQVIRRAAEGIKPFSNRQFVTIACARIDRTKRRMQYVGAGHPPAMLRDGGNKVTELDSTGPIISPAIGDAEWEQVDLPFERGACLLLYTDGITEAAGDAGAFSRHALLNQFLRRSDGGAALLDEILGAVECHAAGRAQVDDFTLLTASG